MKHLQSFEEKTNEQLGPIIKKIAPKAGELIKSGIKKFVNKLRLKPKVNSSNSTLNKFKEDLLSGKLQKGNFGGSRNLGVYDYGDKIIKVVKNKRKISQDQIDSMGERLRGMDNVHYTQASVDLGDGKVALLMSKAKGVDCSKLTQSEIDNIPKEHWDKFVKDIRELSKRGVQTDLTKRDNFFYDKNSGFSFIDISGISIDGSSTKKFFKKGGVEYYYDFEQYPFFEKVFKGGKDMFLNIPK